MLILRAALLVGYFFMKFNLIFIGFLIISLYRKTTALSALAWVFGAESNLSTI